MLKTGNFITRKKVIGGALAAAFAATFWAGHNTASASAERNNISAPTDPAYISTLWNRLSDEEKVRLAEQGVTQETLLADTITNLEEDIGTYLGNKFYIESTNLLAAALEPPTPVSCSPKYTTSTEIDVEPTVPEGSSVEYLRSKAPAFE